MSEVSQQAAGAEELVLVGELTAPFGVRGQMKMRPLMAAPGVLAKLPFVRLRYGGGPASGREERRKVTSVKPNAAGGAVILTFADVSDRNGSEALRGAGVYIPKADLPPLPEGEYYEHDLLGLRVETDTGRDLGVIEKVHYYPANDVYETEVALIPAVEDEIVLEVDLTGRRLVVRDIPGLRKDE